MSKKQPRQFGSRWFRVYDEAADDPKLQMLSDKLHRFLFNCWCLASKHGGYLPPIPEIAWRMRKSEAAVSAMIADLHERGLLDSEADTFQPHNWCCRQYHSDISTPRVKAFRERKRSANETLQKHDETVAETAPEQNRTDTEQKQSRAEQNSPLPAPRLVPLSRRIEVAREPDFCEIDDWFEERISRHPKRGKNLMLAKTMISQIAEVADPAWRAEFTRVHELWIASPSWTGKNLHFAPSMDQWIADKGWKYEPPAVESDTEKAWASL